MSSVEQERSTAPAVPAEAVSGGEAVYWALRALGVEHVFGIVSIHNMPIFEAIDRLGAITHVSCRHEQSATHAADGYARVTGRLGVVIASTGPGTTNTATGLLEAGAASSPVLLITGQAASTVLGKGKGYLHEFEDQLAMLRTLAPHAESVRARREIRETVLGVARRILSGRAQPGAVQIPTDLQWARAVEEDTPWVAPTAPEVAARSLDAAAAALDGAKRPVIWAGGGVASAGAADALRDVAERLGAPVFLTLNARGCLPWEHPSYVGAVTEQPAAWELMAEADAMLAVGTRFQWSATSEWRAPVPSQLVHVDVDPRMIDLNYRASVAVVGDARLALEGIRDRLAPRAVDRDFLRRGQEVRVRLAADFEQQAGPDYREICEGLLRHLPEDAVLAADATMAAAMFSRRMIPVSRPRRSTYVVTGAIGPGAATALGAAIGSGATTVLIQGDGGFMLSVGELATLAETGAKVVVLVFNDQGYGAIRMLQSMSFGERQFATDLRTPDFVAVARAMGVEADRVEEAVAFEAAFERAVAAEGPYLLDIDLTKMPSTSPVEWRKRAPSGLGGGRR